VYGALGRSRITTNKKKEGKERAIIAIINVGDKPDADRRTLS
jgi:hypothetical protein